MLRTGQSAVQDALQHDSSFIWSVPHFRTTGYYSSKVPRFAPASHLRSLRVSLHVIYSRGRWLRVCLTQLDRVRRGARRVRPNLCAVLVSRDPARSGYADRSRLRVGGKRLRLPAKVRPSGRSPRLDDAHWCVCRSRKLKLLRISRRRCDPSTPRSSI